MCRDLPLDGSAREVPLAHIAGRRLSTVEVIRDLPVLALHGAALTQVGVTLGLTEGEVPGRARGALRAAGPGSLDLTSPDGQVLLRRVLHRHNAVLSAPPSR